MGCKQLSYYREATVTEETPFVAVHRGGKTKTLKKFSNNAITGSTGASNYEGAIRSSFGSRGSMISSLFSDQIDDSRPRAFINLMFLPSETGTSIDNNHFAFTQVSSASDNTHAALRLPEYEAPASGFIVIYLSNESRKLTEVYFDDLKITVSESKVVQRDDYYPFGLSFNSWKRSTARENKYLYQGKEQQDDLDLGTFDFHARMYDPYINRTWQLDPMSDAFDHLSPYSWVANNPLKFVDPTGMYMVDVETEYEKRERKRKEEEEKRKREEEEKRRKAERERKRNKKDKPSTCPTCPDDENKVLDMELGKGNYNDGGEHKEFKNGQNTLQEKLINHLKSKHSSLYEETKSKSTWTVDFGDITSILKPGRTRHSGGISSVYIHYSAFDDPKKLFLIVGHELRHVKHHFSGDFVEWKNDYGLKEAKAISEVYAYTWQVGQEGILNYHIGGQAGLMKYLPLVPSSYKIK